MTTYAFAAPVLEGTIDKYRAFVGSLAGPRRDEAIAIRRAAGLDREQVFLQTTGMGDRAVIVWETANFPKIMTTFASDNSEFGVWFRSSLETFHGIDVANAQMPTPTLIDEWKDSSWDHGLQSWAFAFPIKDVAAAKSFVTDLLGEHHDEFVSTRQSFGVKRASFFMFETPAGPLAVQYIQGDADSFPSASAATANDDAPLYVWWREQLQRFAAVPMFQDGSTPRVEELLDLQVRVPAHA